jgi:hypothetical protein
VETRNVETSAAVDRESTTHTAAATHTKALTTTHSKAATTTHTASATHSKSVTAADTVSTTHSAAVSTAAVSTAAVSTATVSTTAAAGRCNSWGKSDRCTDCGGGGNGDERFSKHGSVSSLERTSATTAILAPAADGGLNA